MQTSNKSSSSFWKRLFCVCTDDSSNNSSKKNTRSIEKFPSNSRYNEKKQVVAESVPLGISLQIDALNNESRNEIELRSNSGNSMLILVKQTQKEFFFETQNFRSNLHHIFEVYPTKNVEMDQQFLKYAAPQKVCKYIASRCTQFQSIVEINSYFNQHSIQFAECGLQVISLTHNALYAERGAKNIRAYKVTEKIDQVVMDLGKSQLNFKNKVGDAVFLNIPLIKQQSLSKALTEMTSYMSKALEMSNNLIIFTKSKTIYQNLIIDALTNIIETKTMECWLEKEDIYINDLPEFSVYYFGKVCNFCLKDFLDHLNQLLLRKIKSYNLMDLSETLIEMLYIIYYKIGSTNLMKIFLINFQQINQKNEQFDLKVFMDAIISQKILSLKEIQNIQQNHYKNYKTAENIKQQTSFQTQIQSRKESDQIPQQPIQNESKSYSFDFSYNKTQHTEQSLMEETV